MKLLPLLAAAALSVVAFASISLPAATFEMPPEIAPPADAIAGAIVDTGSVCTLFVVESTELCGLALAASSATCAPEVLQRAMGSLSYGVLASDAWLRSCSSVLPIPRGPPI